MSIVNIRLNVKKQKVFAFFVDLSAAFDSVDRYSLFLKLFSLGVSSKMVNIIRNLYSGTSACVWYRGGLTAYFDTNMGVKQGCVLSPLLFSLFLNDIADCLKGGVNINGKNIKILAYADDIVLIAANRGDLQEMIHRFKDYCWKWNLKINLDKSKIIVFRKGGRPAKNEKWWLGKEKIETVNDYKYLGIHLTSGLNLNFHFEKKIESAKMAMSAFNSIILNQTIPLKSKLQVYNASIRSTVCYGAQVWGGKNFKILEAFLHYFLKKVLNLPRHTPSFMLLLESNVLPVFLHTLKTHLDYKNKCLKLSEDRLPNFLVKELIRKKLYWYKEWDYLSKEFDICIEEFLSVDRLFLELKILKLNPNFLNSLVYSCAVHLSK